ncbi:MAG: MinD/ParA family protein [Ignavibacteria bacterium]|nr:MAG: MinD/ParA family protein [Ignavibacteria bacterium]
MDQAQKLRYMLNYSPEIPQSPKIVSIVSGKGGTGKTFFSINFAYNLAQQNYRVLLVDLDFNLANIHLFLDETPESTIFDFMLNRSTLDETIINYTTNLDVIYGDSGNLSITNVTEKQVLSFIRKIISISDRYDYIIFDNSAGISPNIYTILSASGKLIIVVNPEPIAVIDAYVVFKIMKKNKIKLDSSVVINKAEDLRDGKTAYENLAKASERFLKVIPDYLGCVKFDKIVDETIRAQSLISVSFPEHHISKSISQIATNFVKKHQLANIEQTA